MKTLIGIIAVTLFSLSSSASVYRCTSARYVGFLVLAGNFVSFEERDLGNFAIGKFLGAEEAPFSEWKGYYTYDLIDEASGDSTETYLALNVQKAHVESASEFDIFTYQSHEDHETQITKWDCKEVR